MTADPALPALREVTQSLLAGNEHGFPGDCIRASVASLLDLDPAKVPHFTCDDDVRVWPLALTAFAAQHGWDIKRRQHSDDDPLPDFGIAIGTTTRPAVSHAVVVHGGEMVWDPHPSRDGLVDVRQVIEFTRVETESLEQVRDRLRTRLPELKAYLADRFPLPQADAVGAEAEEKTCAHCQRDLTGASIHTIQGIDVCADIRHCLARQARFVERIVELEVRDVKRAASSGGYAERLRAAVDDDEDVLSVTWGLFPKLRVDLRAALDELEQLRPERKPVRPGYGPGVPGAMHLDAFGQSIADAFGDCPYHVGSSALSKDWRDVDVRLILDDDRFHALFPGFKNANHIDAWWSLLCAAISELGRARTGLPIDFQIQAQTEANEKYSGPRNPLFLIRARDADSPRMDVRDDGEEFRAVLRSGASVSEEDQAALGDVLRAAEDPDCQDERREKRDGGRS